MPIRTSSVAKRITANGQALHRAMARRMATGADEQPSQDEAALTEERRLLKEERETRKAQALQPRPSPADRLVRTRHAAPKAKEAKKETHDSAETKKPKARKSRAEKHAEKAAALDAARKTGKKAGGK